MKVLCASCNQLKDQTQFDIVELFTFKSEHKICYDCKYKNSILEN